MKSAEILDEEGRLLNFIEELGELEWRKFQKRYPVQFSNGIRKTVDCSASPPYVSFRFVADESGVVEKLQAAIDSYKGEIKWVMVAHQREGMPGINWMICPRRIQEASSLAKNLDMTAGQYLAETDPEFGSIAYDDFAKLEEYLRYELGGVRRQG